MITTKITHIAHLAEICAARGVRNVVLSPGSRNAPLIIAFDKHPDIKTYLIHDERSAAFFALGMAEELDEPVAIACTSGSAPLNYSPAIAEAYYRNIPLLVLTADRPVNMVDQGDGQTIRQKNVFHNFIKAEYEFPDFPKGDEVSESDQIVNKAMDDLFSSPQGPVHINIPLSEPLYEIAKLDSNPEIGEKAKQEFKLLPVEQEDIQKIWTTSEKKLVLIGQMTENGSLVAAIERLAEDPSVAILVENTANIQHFGKVCHCIDRTLLGINEGEIPDFTPDLLVTFGGAVVSKKIKAFFRTHQPKVHWRVGIHPFEQDTYQCLTKSIPLPEEDFTRFVNDIEYSPSSNFGNRWKQKDFLAKDKHEQFLANLDFCDLKAFELILDTVPDDSNLQMGNSSVVRYCQLFDPVREIKYYSNRGVSGIDGPTSTAVGMAVASKGKLTTLITGDIAFFYDSNALWNNYLPSNLRIIVINNGGGGIFRIIPGPDSCEQKDYFFAPHTGSVKGHCDTFNLNYFRAASNEGLMKVFSDFYSIPDNGRPCLLEVDTTGINNHEYLKDYFKNLR